MDSFLGSAAGVLRALMHSCDMDEVWGLSSFGFRTQVHRTLDPVGLLPRQWDATLSKAMRRLGCECIAGLRDVFYTEKDLRELQVVWMNNLERALEDGRPAIGFGLHGPAFGVIYGLDTDAEEYHVSTFMDGRKDAPVNVQDFGSLKPPLIFAMVPTGPVADYDYDIAARDSLKEAVDHHLGQEKDEKGELLTVPADLVSGPAAYNAWSTAIETGHVQPHFGPAYHGAYYAEARSAAAEWLRRLATRGAWKANAPTLQKAAAHLDHEVESFRKLPQIFPINQPEASGDPVRRTEASVCMRAARAEHIAGMELLVELLSKDSG
jgi:hypothetical protein